MSSLWDDTCLEHGENSSVTQKFFGSVTAILNAILNIELRQQEQALGLSNVSHQAICGIRILLTQL